MKTLTVAEICLCSDLPLEAIEQALFDLQEKGLVTGFVPGDLLAEINLTAEAGKYLK